MRYKVDGNEIRSENTAKSHLQASSYLVDYLNSRERTKSALDLGCGKLRYTKHLAKKSDLIGVVDSKIQLNREQKIHGETTTIKNFINREFPNCTIYTLKEFWDNPSQKYEFALCSNVLSAIPKLEARNKTLNSLKTVLTNNGTALFVNQHSDSSFTNAMNRPTSKSHLDGWITHNKSKSSYYGILNKQKVVELLKKAGFIIDSAWNRRKSNYVLAKKI